MLRRVKRMRRIRRDVAESANNAAHRMKANGNDVAAAGFRIQDPGSRLRDTAKTQRGGRITRWKRRRKQERGEKIILLVIYIFHKYSLSWEKVKPEGGCERGGARQQTKRSDQGAEREGGGRKAGKKRIFG